MAAVYSTFPPSVFRLYRVSKNLVTDVNAVRPRLFEMANRLGTLRKFRTLLFLLFGVCIRAGRSICVFCPLGTLSAAHLSADRRSASAGRLPNQYEYFSVRDFWMEGPTPDESGYRTSTAHGACSKETRRPALYGESPMVSICICSAVLLLGPFYLLGR